eukprot:s3557_g2.t1
MDAEHMINSECINRPIKPETQQQKDLAKERQRAMAMPEPAPGYNGPRYAQASDVNDGWLQRLLQCQQQGQLLPKKDAYLLVLDVIRQLKSEQTLGRIQVNPGQKLTVFGDIHGQYFDFMNMLSMTGMPSVNTPFLFNGDFVDRGSWSVEVITMIFAMKMQNPPLGSKPPSLL